MVKSFKEFITESEYGESDSVKKMHTKNADRHHKLLLKNHARLKKHLDKAKKHIKKGNHAAASKIMDKWHVSES